MPGFKESHFYPRLAFAGRGYVRRCYCLRSSIQVVPVILALSFLLLAGCQSVPTSSVGRIPDSLSETNNIALTRERLAGITSSEKLARAHAHYATGLLHELNNEGADALEEFYKAALYDSTDEQLMLDTTRQLVIAKRPDKALDLLLLAVDNPNASGNIYARLGIVYMELGVPDKAAEANRIAVQKSPKSLAGYHNLFLSYLQANRPADALSILGEAAKQTKVDAEFLAGVIEMYVGYVLQFPSQREELQPRILTLLDRATALKANPRQLRVKLADAYSMFNHEDKAIPLYRALANEFNDMPAVRDAIRLKLADIYVRTLKGKEATEQLQAITRDDPSSAQAYFYIGSIAYDEERWADAIENLQKAVLFAPGLEQAYYNLAGAQLALGKPEEAKLTLGKARGRFAAKFTLEYMSAVAQVRLKNFPQAVENFTAAEALGQTAETNRLTPPFYFEFGAALERKGDYTAAEKYFNKCLELSPDYDEALNYMGYMWADRGVNLEKAKSFIERALKQEPKSPAYLDSMGWVLFKLNQPGPALDYVKRAVEFSKEYDETLFDHLGDIYAALKQIDKAREFWRKSLEVQPDDAVRKKLEAATGTPAQPVPGH